MGGMLAAIEGGWAQREIQEAAYQYQRSIESRERLVVGVNAFRVDADTGVPLHVINPQLDPKLFELPK